MRETKANITATATVELIVALKRYEDGYLELKEVLEILDADDIEDIEIKSIL